MRLSSTRAFALFIALGLALSTAVAAPKPPAVGEKASDFELSTPAGEKVRLTELLKSGHVVVIVLRGFPGYQCPVCNAQIGQFLGQAKKFADSKTSLVLVYPGPAEGLKKHADDFVRGKTLPKNVTLVVDPDYVFTKAYGLRWDEPGETAYPSTFVVDRERVVRFAKISTNHGDRSSPGDVLKAIPVK
jgi:thioredoxin-dependent peroxiredoxin